MSEEMVLNQQNLGDDVEAGLMRARSFRLPSHLRTLYKPKKVSIGPYYRHEPYLLREEGIKKRCVDKLLQRCGKTLKFFIDDLSPMVDSLRNAYDELDHTWDDHVFLEMMIIDGCYLLEILEAGSYFDPNQVEAYKHDMLLLENQIPFEVLVKLQTAVNDLSLGGHQRRRGWSNSVQPSELIYQFFNVPYSERMLQQSFIHILDVYRKGPYYGGPEKWKYSSRLPLGSKDEIKNYRVNYIPSAKELHDASVGITATRTTNFSLTHGTINLPPMYVDGLTELAFKNAILFERLYERASPEFVTRLTDMASSYVFFMGNLVKGAEDVSFLRSRGIISTTLPDQEVAEMFNSLCKELNYSDITDSKFWDFGIQVREYYIKMSEPWRKDLFQSYLRSPWAIISFMAAIVIFVLSVIQTICAVLSYVNRK